MSSALQLPSSYPAFLAELKERIRVSQIRAAMAVSRELVLLYWSIGREILTRQQAEGWGARIIDRLARDLQAEFPGVEGFSPRNLKYMKSLAKSWPEAEIVPQAVALLPWGHVSVSSSAQIKCVRISSEKRCGREESHNKMYGTQKRRDELTSGSQKRDAGHLPGQE